MSAPRVEVEFVIDVRRCCPQNPLAGETSRRAARPDVETEEHSLVGATPRTGHGERRGCARRGARENVHRSTCAGEPADRARHRRRAPRAYSSDSSATARARQQPPNRSAPVCWPAPRQRPREQLTRHQPSGASRSTRDGSAPRAPWIRSLRRYRIAAFADAEQGRRAVGRHLARRQPEPCGHIAPVFKGSEETISP